MILGIVALILAFVFLLVDIAYVIPIVAIFAGVIIVYIGKGSLPIAIIGGLIAVAGLVLAALVFLGGGLAL